MYAPESILLYTDKTDYTNPSWVHQGTKTRTEPHDRYDDMLSSFAAIVRGDKENPWSYEYELQLYRIVLAACGVEIDYKKEIVL